MRRNARRAGASPVALVIATLALAALVGGIALLAQRRRAASAPSPIPADLRIVSLSPAITRTLAALRLGDRVVGRTPWCDAVSPDVPIVGSLQDFDAERIVRLRPTHVLVQPPAAGLAPGLRDLAQANGWALAAFPLNGLDDIDAMLTALPVALGVGESGGRAALEADVERLRDQMAMSLVPIDPALPARRRAGRVLWLFSVDPPMAFGPGSYLDDVASRLGLANAIAVRGYPELSLEDIHRAQPDTIVLVRDARGAAAASEAGLRALVGGLDTPAARHGQVLVFADRNAMTPGAGVIDLARALREFVESRAWSEPGDGDRS